MKKQKLTNLGKVFDRVDEMSAACYDQNIDVPDISFDNLDVLRIAGEQRATLGIAQVIDVDNDAFAKHLTHATHPKMRWIALADSNKSDSQNVRSLSVNKESKNRLGMLFPRSTIVWRGKSAARDHVVYALLQPNPLYERSQMPSQDCKITFAMDAPLTHLLFTLPVTKPASQPSACLPTEHLIRKYQTRC